jgi:DNA processing protein
LNDLESLIILNRVEEFGASSLKRLLRFFKSPKEILKDTNRLREIREINCALADKIIKAKKQADLSQELKLIEQGQIKLITIFDKAYPFNLRHISSPPILLYLKGELQPEDAISIAIVGSRNPTFYGRMMAERLASELAGRGITVVSGFARGIDSAGHRGALKAGGRTLAILGNGIDIIYPPENRNLAREIQASGALISEFPLTSPPLKRNFPRRNRLISGLSLGVIVVEAAEKSGSLITADFALDQGREVFAVPGKINSYTSKGTHNLIKQGAKLIDSSEGVIEELMPVLKNYLNYTGPKGIKSKDVKPRLDDLQKKLYSLLSSEPRHIDQIIKQTGLLAGQVSGALLKMEMKKLIKELPGKYFVKYGN